jgi:hypothetical protein
MNPSQRGMIPVNPELVANQIKLFEAKLGMQKTKLNALLAHGKQTRALVRQVVEMIAGPLRSKTVEPIMNAWQSTHHSQEGIEKQIIEVAIAELESQIFIHKKLLEEADQERSRLVV